MFNIFQKKTHNINDLIHEGFIDIHSHILPGIDDGVKNLNESLELISLLSNAGFKKIIGTPHSYPGLYDNTNNTINNSFMAVKKKYKGPCDLAYASEYMLDFSLIDKAEKKTLLTLKDNIILVEMSYIDAPKNLYDIIFSLITNGYTPLLAHPERYRFYFNDFNNYFKLKDVGCKFQLNLLSTTGYYGSQVFKISNKLLENNMIDFVGSDIHNKIHASQLSRKVRIKNIKKLEKSIEANNYFS